MRSRKISNIIKYVFIFLFCVMVANLCSCDLVIKKAENLSRNIPFNYPGLRLETRYLDPSDIDGRNPRIVCFGDSVTFGWNLSYDLSYPYLLEKHLKDDYPETIAVNTGIGGNTIKDGKKRLTCDVISFDPDIVIINFGLNDAMLDKRSDRSPGEGELYFKKDHIYYLPQVNIQDFENTYKEVIDSLDDKGISVLVLGLNPVLDNFPAGKDEAFRKKQKEIFDVYNMRIKGIAKDRDIDVIDLEAVFKSAGILENFIQKDGLHPSEEGQSLISIEIYDHLMENEFFIKASGD